MLLTSSLSITGLINNNISVLFIPSRAVLLDLENDYSILCMGDQGTECLFYISEKQYNHHGEIYENEATRVTAMVTIAHREVVPHVT